MFWCIFPDPVNNDDNVDGIGCRLECVYVCVHAIQILDLGEGAHLNSYAELMSRTVSELYTIREVCKKYENDNVHDVDDVNVGI